MTAGSSPLLRTVAFAEQEPGAWGAAWSLDGASFALVGVGSSAAGVSAELSGSGSDGEWTLTGENVELRFSGDPERVVTANGLDQLCLVSGRFRIDGQEHAVQCDGYRAARPAQERIDSIRAVTAVLENGEAFGLTAVRPRRAKGHAADWLSAALLADDGAVAVEDPRFSTVYAADGRPLRASLELWIGQEESEQRLRRAAGEAVGPSASGALGELQAIGELFRWRVRGAGGIGVYLLAR